ncbi:MAG: McrB family protein [Clostridium sp.]|uniref:McrB family protein n=1 Tax=Clostridium sp. TaxID=1506 RepID=UPI003D6C9D19
MINIKRFEEILNLENTAERCERVLTEVQPVLNGIVHDFVKNYSTQDSSLLDYELSTYEATLKNINNASIESSYAKTDLDKSIGTRDFSVLMKKFDNNVELFILGLTCYGESRTVRIGMEIEFDYLWQLLRTNGLEGIANNLSEDIKIFIIGASFEEIPKEKFIETVKRISKIRNRSPIFIGMELSFETIGDEVELVDDLWKVWCELKKLREFNLNNAVEQSKSLGVLNLIKGYNENLKISLYGHEYEVKIGEFKEHKLRSGYFQKYFLNENGQMVTSGFINYYKNNNAQSSYEILSVYVNGFEQIYTGPRVLFEENKVKWFIKKGFSKRGQDNAILLIKAMEDLQLHGFEVRDNNYYIATFDNSAMSFLENISEVKERILKAALIFADTSKVITLPKEIIIEDGGDIGDDNDNEGTEGDLEKYISNFDLYEIIKAFEESKFIFTKDIIRDFHLNLTALGDKHFVILNGISGTGKTQICSLYANAIYGLAYEEQNPYLKVIPVRPDWTDTSALFGYYSALQKRYVMTEFLECILNALEERDKPHFIVLDEMNLARVEYYLSDYLSAVESRKPIRLHSEKNIENVPEEVIIPPNIYIIGTVNIDETTYTISDKVLDRAFVMTLSDVNLENYWTSKEQTIRNKFEKEFNILSELHNILKPYNLHFGYRSMDEMISKISANTNLQNNLQMDRIRMLDGVICEKVFPKIRGDESIENLINQLLAWADVHFSNGSNIEKHLLRMKGELERYGTAQFWR